MKVGVHKIVILGGGSAGWITAGILAAEHKPTPSTGIEIVLIESPDVATIGVGEGTWPSMRITLKKIGISETDFLRQCDASFKQGSKFVDWLNKDAGAYYHPFSLPEGDNDINLAQYWLAAAQSVSFSDAVSSQAQLSDLHLAPKLISTPEYSGIANYGYHLDAGKFSAMLHQHCTEKLGVTYIRDHVVSINSTASGDIASLSTRAHGDIAGDLFVDCSGFASVLLGGHYQIPLQEQRQTLFNDAAMVVQVPYKDLDTPIASCTLSTAQNCGWIWDIGLPTRRGIGHVYSASHSSDDDIVKNLQHYLEPSIGKSAAADLSFRKLTFTPGNRQTLWHKNCVAIGIAAGFIEPLEATALVLIELSAQMLSDQLPKSRATMDIIAKRFNKIFADHWKRIIEFLKLHYVLSERRDTDYWRDHCNPTTFPEGLQEQLELWKLQPPWKHDMRSDDLFPWASYQYILYGMKFKTEFLGDKRRSFDANAQKAQALFLENIHKTQLLCSRLPTNRQLLQKVRDYGFQKI